MKDVLSKTEVTVRTVTLTRRDVENLIAREVFGASWGVTFEWVNDPVLETHDDCVVATHKLEVKLAPDV